MITQLNKTTNLLLIKPKFTSVLIQPVDIPVLLMRSFFYCLFLRKA